MTQNALIAQQMGMQQQTLTDADLLNQRKSYDMYGMRGQRYVHSCYCEFEFEKNVAYSKQKNRPFPSKQTHLLFLGMPVMVILFIIFFSLMTCFVFRLLHIDCFAWVNIILKILLFNFF